MPARSEVGCVAENTVRAPRHDMRRRHVDDIAAPGTRVWLDRLCGADGLNVPVGTPTGFYAAKASQEPIEVVVVRSPSRRAS